MDHKLQKLLDESLVLEKEAKITLINDEVNSFDHVINCLIKYCKHERIQAEQCAQIVHNKGAYAVKQGDYDKLLPIYHALIDNGLLAELE